MSEDNINQDKHIQQSNIEETKAPQENEQNPSEEVVNKDREVDLIPATIQDNLEEQNNEEISIEEEPFIEDILTEEEPLVEEQIVEEDSVIEEVSPEEEIVVEKNTTKEEPVIEEEIPIEEELPKVEIVENSQNIVQEINFNNEGTHIPYYYSYGPEDKKTNNRNGRTKKLSRNVSDSQLRKFR